MFPPCYLWCMFIFLLFLGALVVMSVVMGWMNAEDVHLSLSFKSLSHPYYRLGLSFHKEVYLDKEADVFILGMFFLTLHMEFVKPHMDDYHSLFNDASDNTDNDASAQSDNSGL